MSSFMTFTRSGYLHDDFTLYSYSNPRAVMIRLAPSSLNSYARYSPIPDDAPVIHTFLPWKVGFEIHLRAHFWKEYSRKRAKIKENIMNILCVCLLRISKLLLFVKIFY